MPGAPLPHKQLGHSLGAAPAQVNLALWLDYVCPYSKKTYGTIRKKVAPHYGKNSFSYAFHHQVQP